MAASDKESGPPEEDELSRRQMERDWELKQENVLPLETAANEGDFYGRVIKGSQPLTGVQRAGILLIGLQAIGFAALTLFLGDFPKVGPSLKSVHQHLPDISLVWMPVPLLGILLGVRFCWVAFKHRPHG
jgi:hypothetical protein